MRCPKCKAEVGEDSRFCSKCGWEIGTAEDSGGGKADASPTQPREPESLSFTRTLETPSGGISPGGTFALRYKIKKELGRGGMGIVYKAEDLKLKRSVALKFLPPELLGSAEAKERFLREAQAAAALSHPNICTIHEVDEAEGKTYISMVYVEGYSLRDRIKEGPIDVKTGLELAIQATEGLVAAHKKGIVHRDIKSANIMVDSHGQAKIMDFGLAKTTGSTMITREGVTMGTVAYMSPEQAQGKALDHRTDIWSLGVVLYELFGGKLPFGGESQASFLYAIVHEEPKPLKALNPNIPVEIQRVIARAMKKKPQDRYQSAGDMAAELRKYQDQLKAEESGLFSLYTVWRRIRKPIVFVPALAILAVITFFGIQAFNRQGKIRWAREILLPEVGRAVDEALSFNTIEAYNKAVEAEKYLSDDPTLQGYFDECSVQMDIYTNPAGARIYMKEYAKPEAEWEYVGLSPLKKFRVPYAYFRWKFEKEGYETVLAASRTFDWDTQAQRIVPCILERILDPLGTIPSGMVRVAKFGQYEDFFIDRYEVTNEQFKEFIDDGGYLNKDYWKHSFIKDGKTISWDDAIKEFVDTSGRPGPATWLGGTYPDGHDEYPVSGVSWYEAAAYAEYAGKSLPSIFHWRQAVGVFERFFRNGFLTEMTPLSKYGGNGPDEVGKNAGISCYGVYDMAGNVREWCWNSSPPGRVVAGGAWDDETYIIVNSISAPAFSRSEHNGFRCLKYLSEVPQEAIRPWSYPKFPDYTKKEPVSDEVFATLKESYFYDRSELDIEVEKRDKSSQYWDMEKVTFNAAYGNERTGACLFLPKKITPPYQAVVFYPGTSAMWEKSSDNLGDSIQFERLLEFIVKDGRAVIYPLYKGYFERGNPGNYYPLHRDLDSYECSEFWSQVIKDLRRCVDYIETREDIDMKKIAMYSFSWGMLTGTIVPAIEKRFAANILFLGGMGLMFQPEINRPELNPVNYVGRVKIPTLLISGRYDNFYPLELSAKPLFYLLGTPQDQKFHKIYELSHTFQKNLIVKDVLWFLDKYFGPVRSAVQ